MAFPYTPEPDQGEYDWRDVPICAQPCLTSTETGYWYERCSRDERTCCPDSRPEGVSHLYVWDCIWNGCEKEPGKAQDTAEIFMRSCATFGRPIFPNFTTSVPSTVLGDHFPAQYQYKDFSTPAEISPISGLYGGGTLIAWAIAVIAAAFSGIRPSLGRRLTRPSSTVSGYWHLFRQWIWYVRRDAELVIALALPCVAAGDVKLRWDRVNFHQIFGYTDPSFVPAVDGDDAVPDILSIRASLVVINHFLISTLPMVLGPLIAAVYSPKPSSGIRHLVRTVLIWVTMIWCLVVTKPLYCQASPAGWAWPGGCRLTNISMSLMSAKSGMIPGVGCGELNGLPVEIMGYLAVLSAMLAVMALAISDSDLNLVLWIPGVVVLAVPIFLVVYSFLLGAGFFMDLFLGTVVVPFWYLSTQGRECTFGPSSMIAFSDLDQVFALVIGICAGLVSIWDSVTAYREAFRDETLPSETVMLESLENQQGPENV